MSKPTYWGQITGTDAFELVTSGSRGWAQYYAPIGAKFVRIGNLNHNSISLDLSEVQYVAPPSGAEGARTKLQPNDLLISITAELGMVALVPHGLGEAYINQHIALARPQRSLEPRFLGWYFASEADGKARLKASGRGGTKVGLGLDDIRNVPIPLPPLPEQKRIADKLDTVLARVDACRDRLDRLPAQLKRFRQSVLAAAFTGKLTKDFRTSETVTDVSTMLASIAPVPRPNRFNSRSDALIPGDYALAVGNPASPIPEGWRWVALIDIARMESGHTPSRSRPEYWNGDVSWIGIADARQFHTGTISQTLQKTNSLGLANSAARLLPAGTVCVSRTASVGYVVKMGKPMATSQDFVNWVCTEAIAPDWLKWLFVAEGEALPKFGKGTTHTTIYFPEMMALHVALPPIEEQHEIVRRVDTLFAFADRLEARLATARKQVEQLTPALLAKAFRGELVPQDPADEPASELLKRLAAQREAVPPATRGRRWSSVA